MDNYFDAAAFLSSNPNLPPVSTLLEYTYPNFSMPYHESQDSFYYNDAQTNAVAPDDRSKKSGYTEANAQYREQEVTSKAVPAIEPMTNEAPTISTNPDDFSGELNFQLFINRDECYKKSFVYSKQLRKVFLSMNKVLPVQFSWQNSSFNLRVRACMIFQASHSRDKPVQRCRAHKAIDLEENNHVESLPMKFTFRTYQRGSLYQEDTNNGFLSIVTPTGLLNPGRDYFQIDYVFYCNTSCVTGINRRATFLVFTLENENGFVYGRQSLLIQICCCPKRDAKKEENKTSSPRDKRKINRVKKVEKPDLYPVPRPHCISRSQQSSSKLPQTMKKLPQRTTNYPQPAFRLPQSIAHLPQYISGLQQSSTSLPQPSINLPQPTENFPQLVIRSSQPMANFPQYIPNLQQTSASLPEPRSDAPHSTLRSSQSTSNFPQYMPSVHQPSTNLPQRIMNWSEPTENSPQYTLNYQEPSTSFQQSMMNLPESTAKWPQPTISLPQLTNDVSNSTSTMSNDKIVEQFNMNLLVYGGENSLAIMTFSYKMMLREAYESNDFARYREVLDNTKQRIEELQREILQRDADSSL
ncbi:cellular tumor antigen p53-like [Nasonia vitripennis]|uniref:WOM n=1 Tax=Nasonia vitripennis TaxID=7425 RepID=A0A7M7Q077_NASVI|nr:cellular tumor antigen p53-like [Nasonia vitripennis]XP_031778184.1 cellular tumor antigen p53-like [Nasonia vitripennis]QNH85213.1 WOM [Nasonia vitripennis]